MNPLTKGRSIIRRWSDRWRRGAFVLLYHRVDRGGPDPFSIRVSPERFRDQLATLRERWQVVSMRELVAAMSRGDSVEGCVAVTFDDGYEDNLREALPALEEAGVPATVFVVSDDLGGEFWWDRLTRLWVSRRGRDTGPEFRALHKRLRGLSVSDRNAELEALEGEPLLPNVSEPASARSLTPAELRRLAASEVIEIGAHTRTHPYLPDLDGAAQAGELLGSRDALERVLGMAVEGASYPFGGYDHHSEEAASLGGFTYACAAAAAVCTATASPFAIPRCFVGDWSGEELDQHLRTRSPASAARSQAEG